MQRPGRGRRTSVDLFPLWLSLKVALLATGISLVLALVTAWALSALDFPGKEALDAMTSLPLVLPPTVLGYYLLVVAGRESWLGKAWEALAGEPLVFTPKAAVLAAVVHSAPLLIKYLRSAIEGVDPLYVKAARSLGMPEWRIFLRIVLPLARRGVLAATVLAFARSLGDFGVTVMIAGNIPGKTQTLSVAIYQAVESGQGEVARNLVLIVSALGLVIVWAANRMQAPGALRG
ncbi:MAG: molybdate ABC transporter permease subunit [Bryobacter sp.]|jgi:molybdate transport system permease protein|nr:molybdate ABC transporter permease subunit [Bryobacter sp. CoA8 C33]